MRVEFYLPPEDVVLALRQYIENKFQPPPNQPWEWSASYQTQDGDSLEWSFAGPMRVTVVAEIQEGPPPKKGASK